MGKLTSQSIKNAKPKERDYTLADGDGLSLRVRTTGAKSWVFGYRLPGARRWIIMTLGSVKDLTLKDARAQLSGLRKLVAEGIDPRSARAAAISENTQAITMQALFDNWIEFLKLTNKVAENWIKKHEGRWHLHLKKLLGSILARDITRAHLANALDTMSRKGIREETRKGLTTLNLMLDYGLNRHIVEQNYARMLKPKDFAASANRPRSRALTLIELRKLWQALDQPGKMGQVMSTAIKLLILTGARRGEIAGMRWSELDLEAGVWQLSEERTKNRQKHTIYLSKLALELIQSLQPFTGNSVFVFNSGRTSSLGHIHKDALTKALHRLCASELLRGVESFSIHDLRRSAATAWGEHLKVDPHIIEHMLNHQPLTKLIATYQRAVYAEEQKNAWLTWGWKVETYIVREVDNVIPIRDYAW
jgi:integrase